MDHPDYSHCESSRQQRLAFQNTYEFAGYKNYQEFFHEYLMNQTFVRSFYQVEPDSTCLANFDLLEIFDYQTLKQKLITIADQLNSSIDLAPLSKMHQLWLERSEVE